MSKSRDEKVEQLAALPEPELREKLRKVRREQSNAFDRESITRDAMYRVIERRIWAAHPTWKRDSPVTQGKVKRMVWEELFRISAW